MTPADTPPDADWTDATDDPETELQAVRDRLLEEVMANVAFDGWTDRSLYDAARMTDTPAPMVAVAFPDGIADVSIHLHDWADRQMADAIADDPDFVAAGTTEQVERALMARLAVLSPHKEAIRRGMALVASPRVAAQSARCAVRTADRVWRLCGDTATDFNHYTKRALLMGVLAPTLLYWLGDQDEELRGTRRFLRARLAGVVRAGKLVRRAGGLGRVTEAPWRAAALLRRQIVRDA